MPRDNPKIQHDRYRCLYRRCKLIPRMCERTRRFMSNSTACVRTVSRVQRIILATLNFEGIAERQWQLSASDIHHRLWDSSWFLDRRDGDTRRDRRFGLRHCSKNEQCVNEVFDTCRNYCRAGGIASNVYEQLPLGVICRTTRIAPRCQTARILSRQRCIVTRMLFHKNVSQSVTFRERNKCERSDACLPSTDVRWG